MSEHLRSVGAGGHDCRLGYGFHGRHHRQRGAARDPGRAKRDSGGRPVGRGVLRPDAGRLDPGRRLPRRPLRPATNLHGRRRPLYGGLGVVRARAEPRTAHRRPRRSRNWRGADDPRLPGDHQRLLFRGEPRQGNRDLGGLLRRDRGHRADRGRLPHRQRLLASSVPDQHPPRPDRAVYLAQARPGEPGPRRRPAGLHGRVPRDAGAGWYRLRPDRGNQPRLLEPAGVCAPDRGRYSTGRLCLRRVPEPGADDAAPLVPVEKLLRGESADDAPLHGARGSIVFLSVRPHTGPRLLGDGGGQRLPAVYRADLSSEQVGGGAHPALWAQDSPDNRPWDNRRRLYAVRPAGHRRFLLVDVLPGGRGDGLRDVPGDSTAHHDRVELRRGTTLGAGLGGKHAVSRTASLLAIAIMGVFVFATFSASLDSRLANLDLSQETRTAMVEQKSSLGAARPPEGVDGETAAALERAVDESFVSSFRVAMYIAAGLALASAVASALMIEGKGEATRPEKREGEAAPA